MLRCIMVEVLTCCYVQIQKPIRRTAEVQWGQHKMCVWTPELLGEFNWQLCVKLFWGASECCKCFLETHGDFGVLRMLARSTQSNVGDQFAGITSYWTVNFCVLLGLETQRSSITRVLALRNTSPNFSFAIVHIFHFYYLKLNFSASIPLYQLNALLWFPDWKEPWGSVPFLAEPVISSDIMAYQVSMINLIQSFISHFRQFNQIN